MNTELMLFARYEKPYVRLEDVCDELFNLCERKAKEAAAAQKLPVPVLRMTDSRKSPMMIKDLSRNNFPIYWSRCSARAGEPYMKSRIYFGDSS